MKKIFRIDRGQRLTHCDRRIIQAMGWYRSLYARMLATERP